MESLFAALNEENNTNKPLMGCLFLLIIAFINKISVNIDDGKENITFYKCILVNVY